MLRSSSTHGRPRETRLNRPGAGGRAAGRRRAPARPQPGGGHRASNPKTLPRLGSGILSVAVVTAFSVLICAGTGWTYWTATATGQGSAGTGTLTAPADVAAAIKPASTGTVVVTWTASTVNGGPPAQGYHVTRIAVGTGDTSPGCGTSPSQPTTSLTCEDQPQPDGDYRYRVTALHHTWTAVSEPSGTVTVDTTAPDVPSAPDLVAESDSGASDTDGVTNDATATFTGTAEAGSTVRLYSGATLVGSGVATGGTYSITTESALPEGAHVITAKATDAAGHTSAASSGTEVTVDTVAPTVTVARADGQPAVTNTQPVSFTVTFSEPVTGFTAADVDLTAPAGAALAVTGSGTTYTVEVSAMTADGTVTVAVGADAARDLAGNGNTAAPAESSVTRDSTAPAAPAAPTLDASSDTGSSSTDRLTNDTTPTFTGTAEPGSTVTLYEGDTVLGSVVAGQGGSWSITSSTLAEGAHTLTVTATDAAGNTSGQSASTSITIDVTAPAAPSTPDLVAGSDSGSSSTDNYTNDTTPTLSGTAVADTTVTLLRNGAPADTSTATAGSYTFTTGALADGVHTFTATATDAAGNVSAGSAGTAVTVDTVAPVVLISNVTYSSDTRVTTTGTAGYATGDLGTVQLVICSQDSWPCTDNTVYTASPIVSQTTGAWSNTSTALGTCVLVCLGQPTQVHVRATQTDLAGNVGTSNVVSRNYQ